MSYVLPKKVVILVEGGECVGETSYYPIDAFVMARVINVAKSDIICMSCQKNGKEKKRKNNIKYYAAGCNNIYSTGRATGATI